jgi:hypothetical protein
MDNIYIFETRQLDYLTSYLAKAEKVGYKPVVVSNNNLSNDKRFAEFKGIYKHLSVNDYDFELNCFARYFAFASVLTNNDPFILSDSDIFITDRKISLSDASLKNVFIGSEGFADGVSVEQISPHFSVWNRDMIMDFTNFLVNSYQRNQQDNFLEEYYETKKLIFGYEATAISDMTLLYMWVNDNKILYINSNSTNNNLGIDHNISVLTGEDAEYQSVHGRKKIEVTTDGKVNLVLQSGQRQEMSCLHFQGAYKQILNDYYLGNYKKFDKFSADESFNKKLHYLAAGKKLKHYKILAGQYQDIEVALDAYRDRMEVIPDELFNIRPQGGGWSYAEAYSNILQETLASIIALEQCTHSMCKPTNKKPAVFSRLLLSLNASLIVKTNEPLTVSDNITFNKITKEDARNLIMEYRRRIEAAVPLIHDANNNCRIKHQRLGMLNAKQWFKYIRIYLQCYLIELQRIENKF